MLQPSAQSEIRNELGAPEAMSGADALHEFVGFIRRQFAVIAFLALLSLSLGAIYCVTARPSFTAQAQLMIDARKLQVFQQQSILGDIPVDATQVESQVEVLKSENVLLSVVKNLHLTEDPEFVGSDNGLLGTLFSFIFNPFRTDRAASEFELTRNAINTLQDRLSVKRIGLTYIIQISFRSYNPDRAAQIVNAVADAYIVDQLEAKYQATRRASTWLQDRIKELRDQVSTAERAVVAFKTQNNIVSTGGNDKRLLGEQQATELTSQLVIARAHTAEAKARLDRIKSVLKADSPNESFGETVTDTLKNEVVSKLRSQYLELAAREADWSIKYGPNHLAVVNLRNQLREIRNSIFEELKRLGETYKSDYEIARQREEGVQKELALAVSQSQATDVKSVTLRELESTAQTYKSLYDNFLQRYMEAVQQQSFPITEARLISQASRPLTKSSPKIPMDLALACLGGIILGVGIGVWRDLSDRVFRSGEQIESLLQADCIALVPLVIANAETGKSDNRNVKPVSRNQNAAVHGHSETKAIANELLVRVFEAIRSFALVSDLHGTIRSTKGKINSFATSVAARGAKSTELSTTLENTSNASGERLIARDGGAHWEVVDAPLSRFAESIRSIKLANDLNGTVRANRVVGFTSSLPNEGKSTIAFSLAQLMSQAGARTILLDCDLRNPSLTRQVAPHAQVGLIDVISETVSIDDAIWRDPSTNMSFLPVVAKFRKGHSAEIAGSAAMRKLFERLRESYDYIVVDLPPLAPIVDVRAAAHLIDSFVFVIEWGQTKIDVVEHALGHAQSVYDNLLGVVLNKVDMNVFGRYAALRENLYYNEHYGRYGYTE